MDSTRVSEAPNSGSIPDEATSHKAIIFSCLTIYYEFNKFIGSNT
jgi:hypothetical protein